MLLESALVERELSRAFTDAFDGCSASACVSLAHALAEIDQSSAQLELEREREKEAAQMETPEMLEAATPAWSDPDESCPRPSNASISGDASGE